MKTIILAGGKGTRLWPLSRESFPKQFIKIFDDESLFQKAIKRALKFSNEREIFIVTNKDYKFRVIDEIHNEKFNVDIPEENILLEPQGKNTLPALYYGMKKISEIFNNCNTLVLTSDHLIDDNENFVKTIKDCENFAKDFLITFGIKPLNPSTGYGYIKLGRKISENINEVEKFKEKPDIETAKKYIDEGCLWNSGMFLFNTALFMEAVKNYAPEIYKNFESQIEIEEIYKNIPEISVDYGIMEKVKNAAVVKLNTYWSDLGSFDAIYNAFEKDENGNAIRGECILENSENNLVISSKLTSLINLKNLVIVDTDDALLIANRGDTEKVKKIYKILKEKNDKRVLEHRTVYKPWGKYTVLEEGERFKIKRLTVLPKKRLSLQRHFHRSEHWVVVHGMAKITVDNEERFLRVNESTFIRPGELHRLENPGRIPLEIIEVQIGEYVEEDDIERIEDDFGREDF